MIDKILAEPKLDSRLAGLGFIDGLMFASQELACLHQGGFAEDILRASGFSRRDLLSAQRKSGYESRKMCKIIRRATPNSRYN